MESPARFRLARRAVVAGLGRVRAAWGSVLVAYALGVVLTLPLAAVVQASLAASLRHREASERLLTGWDGLWHATYARRAEGLEASFDAGVVGIGAVLRSLDALLRGAVFEVPAPLWLVGVVYLLGWVLLSGGLLARFAGDERSVLVLGVRHMPRMLALSVTGWAAWAVIFGTGLPALSAGVEALCRDVIDERVYAAWLLAKYVVLWLGVLAVRAVVDYAKVAAIADPSRSWRASLGAGARTCGRRLGAVVSVMIQLGLVGLGLLLLYWVVVPGADPSHALTIGVAILIGQASVVARVVMRAWGLASAQVLYEQGG